MLAPYQLSWIMLASMVFLVAQMVTGQQPSGVALNPAGTSTISRPFDEGDWVETRGPGIGLHTGDDGQAQDWARPSSSQTLGSTAFSAINGVVVKAGHSACYGNTVIVFDASTGIAIRYAHLLSISVAWQQQVKAGIDVIGKVGNSGSGEGCGSWRPHLHISVYKSFNPNAPRPTAPNLQDSSSPYAAAFIFTSSRIHPCGGGSSVGYPSPGVIPRHPAGTFVIKQSDTTVYLLRGTDSNPADLHLYGIPSPDILQNPYNQSSVGNQFDFSNVITISSDEFSAYQLGPVVSSPRSLPSNQRSEPDGTLIQAVGTPEVSIVTENGIRRPFATQSAFLGLGFSVCNVRSVSASDYNSYSVGSIVDGALNNTGFVLQAQSVNPTSGASITVAPVDNTGQGGGGTNFNFVYPANITVQLTASPTVGSNIFAGWQLDGVSIGSSNPVALTMNQAHALTAVYANVSPSLTSFSPMSGPLGTQVTISGSAFTGTTSVQFGQVQADFFEVVSDSQINAVVAANTNTGPITVTTIGGTSTSSQQFTITQSSTPSQRCGKESPVPVNNSQYYVQNNEFDGMGARECISIGVTDTSFKVTESAISNPPERVGAYPSIYLGCHWGLCTPNNGAPLPLPVGNIGTATTSWSTAGPSSAADLFDKAYDLWFDTARTTTTQANAAELMIWLDWKGEQPAGSPSPVQFTTQGATFEVWLDAPNAQHGWYIISFRLLGSSVPSISNLAVSNLDLRPFINEGVNRGFIQQSWYLISVQAGFELWHGGAGLATSAFSFDATPGPNPGGSGGSTGMLFLRLPDGTEFFLGGVNDRITAKAVAEAVNFALDLCDEPPPRS